MLSCFPRYWFCYSPESVGRISRQRSVNSPPNPCRLLLKGRSRGTHFKMLCLANRTISQTWRGLQDCRGKTWAVLSETKDCSLHEDRGPIRRYLVGRKGWHSVVATGPGKSCVTSKASWGWSRRAGVNPKILWVPNWGHDPRQYGYMIGGILLIDR
jgi:hypothetical protein